MPQRSGPERPRRRVRRAHAALERVRTQQSAHATAYAAATSTQARFHATAFALRSATAEPLHRTDPVLLRRLEALTADMNQLLDELHQQQEDHANRVLTNDEQRQHRKERRRRDRADESDAA